MAAKKGARPRKARGPSPASPSRARATAEAAPIPREVMGLGLVSALGLAIHTYAAGVVGFGDSEALYATYAQHPQLGYLDHPGLVGAVASLIGHGTSPRPADAHILTSLVGALVPPLVAATASIAGASLRRAAIAGLVVAVTPMIAIGLFALTPDLLLAPLWLLALALGAFAAREEGTPRAARALAVMGLVAGAATWAKASGSLLFLVMFVSAYRERSGRRATLFGAALGLLVVAPLVTHEVSAGLPMLRHRLIETQEGLPPLVKGAGSLTLGQLLYISPGFVVLAALRGKKLAASLRASRPEVRFLALATALPAAGLALISLASRQAEPHWMGPAWLSFVVLVAACPNEVPSPSRRALVASTLGAAVISAAVHAWILVPSAPRLAPRSYDPRYDIANELFGWPDATSALREELSEGDVIVGPHWVVCAQVAAAIPGARVGCDTPIRDDFDGWLPRDVWRSAPRVHYVKDTRFDARPEAALPAHTKIAERRVTVYRGGRPTRTFTLTTFAREAQKAP